MSDTPETDAACFPMNAKHPYVATEFARKLERERDKARKELEEYRSIAENIGAGKAVSEKENAIRERDEAREALENLKASLNQIAFLYESKEMTATVCQRIADAYDMRCIARKALDQLKEGAK